MVFSCCAMLGIGYQVGGDIHCERHQEDGRKQRQQHGMDTDLDLAAPDLSHKPDT
jgi:hypothetical protein